MSTARPSLAATHRDVTGKAVSHLRKAGQLPAVVFGHGVDSTNVSVDAHAFELLRRKTSANALVDLSIDGKKPRPVLVHGVQLHVVTRRPLHADLFLVRMTEEMTVDVPLVATGESEARRAPPPSRSRSSMTSRASPRSTTWCASVTSRSPAMSRC